MAREPRTARTPRYASEEPPGWVLARKLGPRYRPSVETANEERDLLRFTSVARLQAAAEKRATIAAPVEGLAIQVTLTDSQQAQARPGFIAAARKLVRNAASGITRKAQTISRETYKTGLFISSWRAKAEIVDEGRFKILVSNTAPYAEYVKRAGADWQAGRTVVDTYIRPMLREERNRLLADLKAELVRSVKAAKRKSAAA